MIRFYIVLFLFVWATGCTHPVSQTREEKLESIRGLFADSLYPLDRPEGVALDEPDFKRSCFKHVEGLYHFINNPELLEAAGIPSEILQIVPSSELEPLKNESTETILKALRAQELAFFENIQQSIDKAVKSLVLDVDKFKAIQVPTLGESWTRFFKKVLHGYFPSLNLEDKKRVLAHMIRANKGDLGEVQSNTKKLITWVQASGPYFQKYLQLMADYLKPGDDKELQELKEGLLSVKDALPPIPRKEVFAYLEELKELGYDYKLIRSLGAASVGEAFLVEDKQTGKQIVLKLQRPGIKKIAAREREFFLKQAESAQGEALKESFNEIARQIDEELDYTVELEKIKAGIQAYEDNTYGIHVVRPIKDFPSSKKWLAMEFVDGKTFKQLGANDLEKHTKAILWEKVAKKFMQQALFAKENAFFHGDLHEGNIMAVFDPALSLSENATREQVQEAVDQGLIKPVLIDFGNAHSLTQEERKQLKTMFLAAQKISHSVEDFLDSVYPKLEKNKREEVKLKLQERIFSEENRAAEGPEKIGQAMDVFLGSDLAIPGFIMAFKRTVGMLINIQKSMAELEPEFMKRSFHDEAQDSYVHNLNQLLDEMSPSMKTSLLTGIVNKAQSADWEGQKIAEAFNIKKSDDKKFYDDWIDNWRLLRESFAKADNLKTKTALVVEMLQYLSYIYKNKKSVNLPETSKQAESEVKPPKKEPASFDAGRLVDDFMKGMFLDWESQQIAAILEVPVNSKTIEDFKKDRIAFGKASDPGKLYYGLKLFWYLPKDLWERLKEAGLLRLVRQVACDREGSGSWSCWAAKHAGWVL